MVRGRSPDLRRGGGDLSGGGETPGRVFVIFNPASNGGRGSTRIPTYLELLERRIPEFSHAITTSGGEEASLAEAAVQEGYDTIVAAGGDGTWSAIADRLLSLDRRDVTVGVLPAGTGNDFGRNLGIPGNDPERAVEILASGRLLSVDVGRLKGRTYHEARGEDPRPERFFLNVVGFGFDVAVVDASRGARLLRGELLYKATAVQQLFRFPGFPVTLEDDEGFQRSGKALMLTVTNGEHFGGGFPIAPGATVQDSLLHACFIGDVKPLRRIALFDGAGKGKHEGFPEVEPRVARRFRVKFPEPARLEMDGDVYAASDSELELEIVSGALKILAPPATD